MKVSVETIKHVAKLARLELLESETEKLALDMEGIIGYVDKLNEVDTENIIPREHVMPLQNVFREDVAKKSFPLEEILLNAPSAEKGCFKVPKIVD